MMGIWSRLEKLFPPCLPPEQQCLGVGEDLEAGSGKKYNVGYLLHK